MSERKLSGEDMRSARLAAADPALSALAEVLQLAAPGVKLPPARFAAAIDMMLRKRGFHVAALGAAAVPMDPGFRRDDSEGEGS